MTTGDPFRRVRPGGPIRIPAAAQNVWNDMAKAALLHRHDVRALPGGAVFPYDTLVRNDTGGDLPRFSIVALGAPITKPVDRIEGFTNRQAVIGTTPVAASRGRFAILQEPIREDAVGLALAVGMSIARVELPSPNNVDADWADVKPAATDVLLASGAGAARILWVEPFADREAGFESLPWCIVRLGAGGDPGMQFAVKVTEDGGVAGSVSTNCTWTYTVKDLRGRTLATAKSPLKLRNPDTPYMSTPADSIGTAYYDEAGVLQLLDANERFDLEEC